MGMISSKLIGRVMKVVLRAFIYDTKVNLFIKINSQLNVRWKRWLVENTYLTLTIVATTGYDKICGITYDLALNVDGFLYFDTGLFEIVFTTRTDTVLIFCRLSCQMRIFKWNLQHDDVIISSHSTKELIIGSSIAHPCGQNIGYIWSRTEFLHLLGCMQYLDLLYCNLPSVYSAILRCFVHCRLPTY